MNHHKYTKNHQTRTSALPPDGVSIDIWNKFLNIRVKKKKGRIRGDELANMRIEGASVGMTLEEVLLRCVLENWATFSAHWLDANAAPQTSAPAATAQRAPVVYTCERLAENKTRATAAREYYKALPKLAQATSNQTR